MSSSFFGRFARRKAEQALGPVAPRQGFKGSARAGAAFGAAALSLSGSGPHHAEDKEPGDVVRHFDAVGYKHTVVKGRVMPPCMSSACVRTLQQDFALRGSDIVIATYPKCGTTWMQQIVLMLLHEGDRSNVQHPMAQAPWIEMSVCNKLKGSVALGRHPTMSAQELMAWDGELGPLPAPPRRVFKTHAPADMVPWRGGLSGCGGAKVIVVTRNPKDACVSMFHHTKDSLLFEYRGDFHHFVTALFLGGNIEHGCFWDWHAGWEKVSEEHPGTVVWVSYEELKRDFAGTVQRLGHFLDIPVPEDLIAQAQNGASFKAMKDQMAKTDSEDAARGLRTKKNHIRKGEMGSWRGDIHGALLAEFDAVHSAKTALSGLKYTFDFGDT